MLLPSFEADTHSIVLLAIASDRLVQVLLAAVTEALDGLRDTTQRAKDLIRVHVLCVILQHTEKMKREREGD